MRHLLTQLKNPGYYLNGIKTWLSPTNNLLITYLSPTNHLLKSRAHRCAQFAVTLLVMAVLSVGNVWGYDFDMELDQIRVLPTRSALVTISNISNTETGSGKLKVGKGKVGAFTFTATVSSSYKIKSIAFVLNNTPDAFSCTAGGSLSGSATSWTFTPTGNTPLGTASFSLEAPSGKDLQITPTVTMTTDDVIVVEELKTFTYSAPNFSFVSSATTSQVIITNKANADASSNYINLSKSGNERSITISAKTGYNLKFISFYYYDAASNPSVSPTPATYTASTYTWIPSSKSTSVDFSFDASSAGVKIWKIYVGYETDAVCTAPNHVDVSGNWGYFKDETITLTAQAYSSEGTESPIAEGSITGYQWKHNGVNIAGATSKTFTKTASGAADGGDYSCVVSTGATCSTESSLYGVKVYELQCYTGGTTSYHFTRDGSNKIGTVEVPLNNNTQYQFKIYAGSTASVDYYMGNNGTIEQDVSNWDFEGEKNNVKLNSGLGGTFLFTIDYTANGGAPKVSVTYPRKTIYMKCGNTWCNDSPVFFAHTYGVSNYDVKLTQNTCDATVYQGIIPAYNSKVIFTRQAPGSESIAWSGNSNFWNESQEITLSTYDLFTCTGWSDGKGTFSRGTYSPATFTITFVGGTGSSGSMSAVSGIICDANQVLPANSFTKTDYIFAGWHADVDVKVGGSTVVAGGNIADEATLQNIGSNITLTAQWTACTGPTISAFAGTAGQTYSVGATATTMTITAAAGNGGTLHYHWYQYNVGQDPLTQSIDAVGFTDANTYTPSTASTHEGQIFYCVVSEEGCSTTAKSAYSGAITVNGAAEPIISWDLKVNASWVDVAGTTTDGTNVSSIVTSTANTTVTNDNKADKTSKLGLASSATPDKYVEFSFFVACGKKLTPDSIVMKVLNVGGSSGGKMTHKAELSDKFGHSINGTVQPASDGTLTKLKVTNGSNVYFQGAVSLKVWAWNHSGTNGTALRMGKDVDIYGEIANQATPAATITWDTQPVDGEVGDADATIAAHASDGSTITYTSNDASVATIVDGKVHYVAAGTTTIKSTITDQCGNAINQNSSSFTVTVPVTYTLTVIGASVANPMTEDSKTGAISGVMITGSPVSGISSGTTTSTSDNTFTVNKAAPETVTASAIVSGSSAECDECTYRFKEWKNLPSSVTANVSNIEAVYNTTYTISFKETDGTDVAGISRTYYVYGIGKSASALPTPTKSGYEFGGWYQENTLTNAATDIDDDAYGNVTYYAKWAEDCKKSLSKVVLTSASAGTVTGYNDGEYAGSAVIDGLDGTKTAEVDDSHAGEETGYKLKDSGKAIVFATIKKGNFRVGDVVKVTITYQNDNYTFPSPVSAKTGMDIYYGTNKDDATRLTTISGVTGAGTYSYTLTAADITTIGSKKGIGVFRHSDRAQNHHVYSVEIVGCREKANIYNFASGAFNDWSTCNGGDLSMTGSQSGVSYQLYKDGVAFGDPKAGTGSNLSWHVTANGTYTVKSIEDATYVETDMNGSAVVTLNDPTLVGESSVAVGSTITLSHPDARETNNWVSSNPAVATVSSTGVVTGVSIGSATITFHGLGSCNGTKVITVTAPPTYTVTYHDRRRSEGPSAPATTLTGSVPTDANEYDAGDVVTVAGNTGNLTFVIGGATATFGGWVTNENGWIADRDGWRGNFYAAGETFNMPASNVDLYAVWTFPIAYFTNGGTINDASYDTYYTYTYNIDDSGIATATDLPSEVTKTGYEFDGWYHDAELTDGPYDALGIMGYWYGQFNAYAKWTENLYDITYDSNGGSGSMSNTHGHYVTIANNNFTNSGYIFNGWNTAADGSGTSYDAGEEIELTADLTLYAQWKLDYTITWGNVQIGGAGATVTPNLGGGNYTITVNTGIWTGSLTADMLSASAGVTITNVTIDNSGSPKTATLTFSVGADVVGSTITLTIDVPAHGDYSAKTDNHVISIDRCEGVASVWDFTTNPSISISNSSWNNINTTSGTSNTIKFYAASSGDGMAEHNDAYCFATGGGPGSGSENSRAVYINRVFYLDITSNGTITFVQQAKNVAGPSWALSNDIKPLRTEHTAATAVGTEGSAAYTYTVTIDSYNSTTAYRLWFVYPSKGYISSITWTPSGGSGSEATTLTWSDGLANDGSAVVIKNEGAPDFTYMATPDNNTLGVVTYSSSDAHVTVSSTGTVHIGDGIDFGGEAYKDITISATVARSGCYEGATITYTLRVNNSCEDVAGTIEIIDLGCDKQMTVSGHTADAGVSYQWYKVGSPDVAVGTNSATYTTSTPGSYYVIVTNTGDGHCAMASKNTVVVEEREGFEISKIIDYWYVKNGRRTPDIELVQTANAGIFTVKVSGSTIDNIGGCHFYLGDDGIIYLKGTQDNGDAPSGLTDGENITLQITVNQECGDGTSYVEIEIRCQGATTRPSIAFVVDGDKGEDFDDENEEHSVETALYKFLDYGEDLSGAFDLTGQNIYSTTDEKLIREHYSQFDAVLVTDDPSTKANPSGVSGKEAYKTKGYVNAFGALIDVRPILTMEAYVSALANWDCVKGDPTSPNPRQYEMRLQCKNHEIYGGLPTPSSGPGISNVWEEIIDGEEYRHVIMVDSTLSPYTGIAYNVQTGGEEKPALQGFTLEAMGELLGLGVISDGALQAGIERQHEPAARMMILGINAKALPHALTPEGKKVIENAITYLLKTNMEDVDDCSNFFVGGTSGHEKDWSTLTNWSKGSLPSTESKVRILAPCEISNAVGHVAQIEIASSGSSKTRYTSRGDATCDGNLVIAADGALVVNGKIYSAVAPYFNSAKLTPTSPSELKIEANSSNTGALIFDNSDGKAQATVEMYSASYWEVVAGKKKKWWSYVGVPITNVDIPNYFYLGFTYLYDETSGWIKKWDGSVLQPFEGIGLSMQSGHKETFYGTLASTATKEISLTKTTEAGNGENLIGNSWTAPIQIANFETADFGGATATVYVYNTGRDDVYHNPTYVAATEDNDGVATAGQWVGVPINVASLPGYTGLKVVPAMNAFQVNTSSEATLTLDYDKLVRKNAITNANINNPLRAPRRTESVSEIEALMRVRVTGEYTHTDVWLLQDEQFTDKFDNGWEAKYQDCDNRSAQMYAESELGRMAFLAKPNIDGTVLGFAPSRDGHEYTFSFYYLGDEALYLNDMQLEASTLIDAENTYTFTYSEEDMAERFIISRQAFGAPAVTTGNERISDNAKPIKFIKDDRIFILVRGILYDITGKVVR